MKRSWIACVALACVLAGALASVAAPAGGGSARQRIALVERFDTKTGTGTWRIVPLTAGPIRAASGTLVGTGRVTGTALRNGGRVTRIVGEDTLTGRAGTIVVSQRVESADVRAGYSADIGSWRLVRGTGAYAGLAGGGRFAAVGLPTGVVLARQEGWVSR